MSEPSDPPPHNPIAMTLKGFLFALIVAATWYTGSHWDAWTAQRHLQVTDDSYLRADITPVAAKIEGYVSRILVHDNESVRAGQLLAEIDASDYVARRDQALAELARQQAALVNLHRRIELQQTQIAQAEANLAAARAEQIRASTEQERIRLLRMQDVVSQQLLDNVSSNAQQADATVNARTAAVDAAVAQLAVTRSEEGQALAGIGSARAALQAAELNVAYARITSPVDGIAGQRSVFAGQYVRAGSTIVPIVHAGSLHVIANYKETQVARVRPGQVVGFTVDSLPGRTFRGQVESLAPASGSQFALLPPDNATGNFTKVIQRVPVRVRILPDQGDVSGLRPGMSVVTEIDTDSTASSVASR